MSAGTRSEPTASPDARDLLAHRPEDSPFGAFIVDADFRVAQVSAGAHRVFENVRPLFGRDFSEVVRIMWSEPFASEVIGRFRHCLDNGEPYRSRNMIERRLDTDQVESYDWQIERLMMADGRAGVVCQFYDLWDRRNVEVALRRAEERSHLALDAAGAMVYEVSPAGRFVAHGLERLTGFRPEDVDPTLDWWYSLIHPDDVSAHRDNVARQMETGGPQTRVFRIRRKDGAWIWVEATAQVLKDDSRSTVRLVGAVIDITQRKLATDALRESEQRFRTLHALSSRLLAARDLTEALEDVLDCAMASCGAALGLMQLFNAKSQALEIVAQRNFRQPFLDHFRAVRVDDGSATSRALQSGEQFMIEDVQRDPEFAPHRDVAREAGYRAVVCTPLKTHDGAVLGMLVTNFREAIRVPERDRQLLEIYARHAADLVSRLRFEQALRDAERRKDEFLAMLAHEMRSPLAPISNALELIRLAPGNAGLIESSRATMERQLGQLTRLVDDLLDVSRITSHKLELRMEILDLASVVQHAAEACRPMIDRRSQTLSIELPEVPFLLRADPVRLAQVLGNLITNASKYTDAGGRIRVVAQRDANDIAVSVIDNGWGIPPELLPRVFDLFMQVEGNSDRSGGGLGIGLSLVRRLVEMHGGTVIVQSEGIGRGTSFVVHLPLARDPDEDA